MTNTTPQFFTDAGIEVPAVTADQMREVDRIAMEETGPNLYQMMENAGSNLALLAIELLGHGWEKARIITLAGSGGNGGGGICASRHLANRNENVRLCLVNPIRLGEVPAFQRRIFGSTRGTEISSTDVRSESADLIIDAIVGYGLTSAPRGVAAELIQWANGTNAPIVALDLPSGVNATTGERPGDFIKAGWTMTLALPKTGLKPESTGELFLADIGIPQGTYNRMGLSFTPPFRDRSRVHLSCR